MKSRNGFIHKVRTYKGRGEGSSQIAYDCVQGDEGGSFQGCVRTQIFFFFGPQNLKTFLFCTKEAITLPFIIVHRKV